MTRQKPGEVPARSGEYKERGPRGGDVARPRTVTIEPGDRPLPPHAAARTKLGTYRPAPSLRQGDRYCAA